MVKYKKQFKIMLEENEFIFKEFKLIHDEFVANRKEREEFDEKGGKVLRIIRRYEDMLCAKSENSGFGRYSENLSEKFWEEVRSYFPRIDDITLQ